MIKRWEVKEIYNDKWKRVWYIKVIEFIRYLID